VYLFKKTYQMNIDKANDTLQNVFAACNKAPNTIPFDKLVLQQAAHTRPYDYLLWIITIMLALTLLAPLSFIKLENPTNAAPIVLTKQCVENNKLYLTLDSGNHVIHYEEAYLVSPGGTIYEIVSYDTKTNTLCFPNIAPNCNIYIPYDDDQTLHLQLDSQ